MLKLSSIALAVAFAFATAAQAQTTQTPKRDTADKPRAEQSNRKAKNAEEEQIEAAYKADKAKCDTMSGNAKDVCMKEAKGKEKVAKAELELRDKDTAHNRYEVAKAKAEAEYDVAKERCDDQKGKEKDACQKEAKAAKDRALSAAKAENKSDKTATRGATSDAPAPAKRGY